MAYDRTHPRGVTDSATSMAWSISFGDLLTLLVCFFLVLTQSWVSTPVHSHEDRQVISQISAVHAPGTALATVPVKEPQVPPLRIEILRPPAGDKVVRTVAHAFDEALGEIVDQSKGRKGYLKVQLCLQEQRNELAIEAHRLIEQSKQRVTGWEVELSSVCEGEARDVVNNVMAVVEFS